MAEQRTGQMTIIISNYLRTYLLNEFCSLALPKEKKSILIELCLEFLMHHERARIAFINGKENNLTQNDIIHLYETIHGGIRFALPLCVGVTLETDETKISDEKIIKEYMKAIGESLGIISTLDDDTKKYGPLWSSLVIPQLTTEERERYEYITWTQASTYAHTSYLRNLNIKYGIEKLVAGIIANKVDICHKMIHDLPISKQQRRLWHTIVTHIEEQSGG
jgi:hypothetical protein